jgi:hypothetical protein
MLSSYILKLHCVCSFRCRSWFQDLDGRTGSGLEIEVPKVTWCLSVCLSSCRSWFQNLDGQTGPGFEIEVPRWKRRTTTTNGGGPGGWSGVATGCPHSTGPGLEIEVSKVTWCLSVCLSVQVSILVSGPRRTDRTKS